MGAGITLATAAPIIAGTVIVLGTAAIISEAITYTQNRAKEKEKAVPTTLENTETDNDNRITLYKYSLNPNLAGNHALEDDYLTDDPTMSSDEAVEQLALPDDRGGEQLYVYPVKVPADAVRPGDHSDNGKVRPTPHEGASGEKFRIPRLGGANEFQINPGRESETLYLTPKPAAPPKNPSE